MKCFLTEIDTATLETARFSRTGIANSLETAEVTILQLCKDRKDNDFSKICVHVLQALSTSPDLIVSTNCQQK